MASPHTLKTSVCTVALALAVGAGGIVLDPYQFANECPTLQVGRTQSRIASNTYGQSLQSFRARILSLNCYGGVVQRPTHGHER